jgi:hypothetical protein
MDKVLANSPSAFELQANTALIVAGEPSLSMALRCTPNVMLDFPLITQSPAQGRQQPRHEISPLRTGTNAPFEIPVHDCRPQRCRQATFIRFPIICPPDKNLEKFLHLQRRTILFNCVYFGAFVARCPGERDRFAGFWIVKFSCGHEALPYKNLAAVKTTTPGCAG